MKEKKWATFCRRMLKKLRYLNQSQIHRTFFWWNGENKMNNFLSLKFRSACYNANVKMRLIR